MAGSRRGIVVVGGGIAGLFTALKLAPRPVTLVTAERIGEQGASAWAQGGLAAAIGSSDSPEAHLADTVAAGGGLVEREATKVLCEEGPARIDDLVRLGVDFDRDEGGALLLGTEAAHTAARIVHVKGDEAGAAIIQALTKAALASTHITLLERTVAARIITDDRGVTGLVAWDAARASWTSLSADHIVLATGGVGGLFSVTTNPLYAIGHGLILAHHAGASLRDLEFVQFHPTGLDIGVDPAPLATEALRGEGATLHDRLGRRFMQDAHPHAELAPRDVVARGVAKAIRETGRAFLDTRGTLGPHIAARFPTVTAAARAVDIDPVVRPLPVAPAAHYHMGGIVTDTEGRTDVPGLYAVGECASTGVHGANRLASNSLLEALVFGARTADAIPPGVQETVSAQSGDPPTVLPMKPPRATVPLRTMMAEDCGLLRNADGLGQLLKALERTTPATEGDRVFLSTAHWIARCALARCESRGAHWRTDHPEAATDVSHSVLLEDTITHVIHAAPAGKESRR